MGDAVMAWPFRVYLAVFLPLALLYPLGGPVLRAVVYGVISASVSVAMLAGLRRHRPRPAAAWLLLWGALQISLTGDVVMGLRVWLFPDVPALLVLESVVYLLAYPALAAGLAVVIRNRSAGRDRGVVIDSAIVACALALPLWLVAAPSVPAEPGQPVVVLMVRLALPLGDVALLTLLARLLVGGGARNTSLYLLLAGVCGWLAGDVTNAALAERGTLETYVGGVLYCLSYTAFGAAALHPSMPRLTVDADAPASRLTSRRLAVLAGLSLMAPVLLLVQAISGRPVDAVPIGVACVLLFLLVVARLAGLTRQVEQQARELSELAARDGLTGVGNRRSWDIRLRELTATGQPLVVALLDLDHFKRFNDAYGHQAGDRLLQEATAAWRAVLGRDDVLYRYGGEEFGLALPGVAAEDALELIGRLRDVVPSGQTFSAGVAVRDGAESAEDLVARADTALYGAKTDGRACTREAGPVPARPREAAQGRRRP